MYRVIGKSGLRVSPLALGTMTFGSQCDEKDAFNILDKAAGGGINFIDTAEIYPVPPQESWAGRTEKIIGHWLEKKSREKFIIATKISGPNSKLFVPPVRFGLTALDRHHIVRAVEGSLKRLKTDYIDLYQTHWPEHSVPIEETLEAMYALVKSGKIRYVGLSNESIYSLTKAAFTAKQIGFSIQSLQNNFSLLNRSKLDEINTVYEQEGISLLAYSLLAGGVLTGKYQDAFPPGSRFGNYLKSENKRLIQQAERYVNDRSKQAVERYKELANSLHLEVATLSIAWVLHHKMLASAVIGVTHADQLDVLLKAFDVRLSPDTMRQIDKIDQEIPLPIQKSH